jgi:UDP-N-acetylmuramate dehydrogenase
MKSSSLRIGRAPSLAELTTIRLGGRALARVRVEDERGLAALPGVLSHLGGRPVVLGQGSNILAAGGELPLVLVELGTGFAQRDIRILASTSLEILAEVSAAWPLPLCLGRFSGLGMGGLSGLTGIPGRVGGAVAMNAGAFGQEIKDRLRRVRLFSPALGLVTLEAEELDMGYRHFSIPSLDGAGGCGWFILLSAAFNCPRQETGSIRAHMRDCMERKRLSQPLSAFSAGCVFKNPPEAPAGKLLEECGMKGRSRGGMSFSALHANFLVNNGAGRPEEALELIEQAQSAVRAATGLNLELEVRIWS